MKKYNVIVKGVAVDIYRDVDGIFILPSGFKTHTALKPSLEPITVARKPLSEKSIAENCLKWGTGGINIDGCRVGTEEIKGQKAGQGFNNVKGFGVNTKQGNEKAKEYHSQTVQGRFPANLIIDGSEEVCELFPNSKGASSQNNNSSVNIYKGQSLNQSNTELSGHREWYNDNGSASRFFKDARLEMEDLIWDGSDMYVNNVAKNFGIMNVIDRTTLIISVLKNATQFIDSVKSCLTVLCVEKKLNRIEMNVVQSLVRILSNGTEDYITLKLLFQKKEDLELTQLHNIIIGLNNLVLSVKKKKPLKDTIQIIQNLKILFGCVGRVICESTMARFKYNAKTSKKERNAGCYCLEKKEKVFNGQSAEKSKDMKGVEKKFTTSPSQNNHPTVKPISLMSYLVRLVTPKNGIVLDPFTGSGSTICGCIEEKKRYIGFELSEEYCEIAVAREQHYLDKQHNLLF